MTRQRNTAQMKEQDRKSQDQINKNEISNLPEREFRIITIRKFGDSIRKRCLSYRGLRKKNKNMYFSKEVKITCRMVNSFRNWRN